MISEEDFSRSDDRYYQPFSSREYHPMSVEDFIKRVINGERDFENVGLYSEDRSPIINLDTHELYDDLKSYLRDTPEEELQEEPIRLNDSYLKNLRAAGLKIPYLEAEHSVLDGAYLSPGGVFKRANFFDSSMKGFTGNFSDFTEAVLDQAEAPGSVWIKAVLNDVNIKGTNIEKGAFDEAELEGVDLHKAKGFTTASY